jgi:heptosyltransferase I
VTEPSFLIVRLGALGDIVHTLPLAAALRARFPEARLDWLVDVRHRAVLSLVPGLSNVAAVDTRRWRGESGVPAVVARLRQARYAMAFDPQGLLKSALLARLSGAARVVGLSARHLRERTARFCYTETIEPGDERHVVRKNLALARVAGIDDAPLVFPLAEPAADVAARVRGSLGLGPDAPFALVNPGAAWPNKRWPPERFGAVAAHLAARHALRSAVLWGPGEAPLAEAVVAASEGTAVAAPPTTLGELVALLRAARLVLSGDTGPLHLAAALGTPVVGLFGPTDPERNGPWAAADVTVSRIERCACVYQRRCRAERWCLDDVTVSEVAAAVARRLGTAEGPP